MTFILTFLIKMIGCIAGIVMWFTVGLAVWSFKLLRVSIAFSVKTMLQAFKEQDMAPIEHSIQVAINFWPQGFKRIIKIFDSSAADRVEIQVSWSNLIPGLLQDLLYFVIVAGTTYALWAGSTPLKNWLSALRDTIVLSRTAADPTPPSNKASGQMAHAAQEQATSPASREQPRSPFYSPAAQPPVASLAPQAAPKWLDAISERGIVPAKAIGGVNLGQPVSSAATLLGVPSANRSSTNVSGAEDGLIVSYTLGPALFEVHADKKGVINQLVLMDTSFGRDTRFPAVQGVSFGNSEAWVKRNFGEPSTRRALKSAVCAATTRDEQATILGYAGIRFYVCAKNDSVFAILVTK